MKCKNCDKELEQTVGKREKIFCNSTCRSNFWQKNKKKSAKKEVIKNEIVEIKPNDTPKMAVVEIAAKPKEQKLSGYLAQRQQMKNGNK
jgi:hypothetical protein